MKGRPSWGRPFLIYLRPLIRLPSGTGFAKGLGPVAISFASCTWDGFPRGRMSQAERFANLLHEFERVGVDPNTISAGLAIRQEDALRALAALPDGAGPAAFLAQLRALGTQAAPAGKAGSDQ